MKLNGKHTTHYEVEISPEEALHELERLLLRQAGIQSDFCKLCTVYINMQGQIVEEKYIGPREEEIRVLVDRPAQRQLELLRAFKTLKYEMRPNMRIYLTENDKEL